MAPAGGQRAALKGHHAEGDVFAVLVPFAAHQFQHLEQLPEVQVLLIGDDIQALVEVVGLLAVPGRSQVPGDIQSRAVAAQDQRRGHTVVLEVHNLRALVLDQQTLLLQLIDDGLHLVVVEALARIGIKRHAQQVIDPLRVLEGHGLEPVEDLQRLGIAVLNLLEPGAALVVQGRVLLGLLVEAHIQLHHLVHAPRGHGVVVAPALVGRDHLAELGAPVAQMVHAHRPPAEEFVQPVQGVADHGGGKMADVKALGDVDAGIVQHHGLPRAGIVRAIALALLQRQSQHLFGVHGLVDKEIQIALHRLHLAQKIRVDRPGQGVRYHCRALAQGLGQLEAGKCIVPHGCVRRNFQRGGDVRGGNIHLAEGGPDGGQYLVCDGGFEIHIHAPRCQYR